ANHYDLYSSDGSKALDVSDIPLFRALKGESVKNAEIAIAPKQGRRRFVLANGDPIVTKEGRQLGAVVAMRDVTVQRQAELQLLESQKRYRLVAENLQDLLIEHSTDGVIRYASVSSLTLTGYDSDDLVGTSLLSLMHPDDVAAFQQTTTASGLSALPSRAQYRIRHHNGSYRWFESSSSVVVDEVDSDQVVVISVLRDITDRKQFEAAICELNDTLEERVDQRTAALKQANLDIQSLSEREQTALGRLTRSEQEYRSVVNGIQDIIFKLDLSGNLVFLNPAWTRILEFDIVESLGNEFVGYVLDEDRSAFRDEFERLKGGDSPEGSLELRICTATGVVKWLDMDARLLEATQSLPTCIGGTLVDITKRKESEALLQRRAVELETINAMLLQTTALAEQRNKELDQFAYVTSHDLKAPLRAISNLSQWIEEDLEAVLTDETRHQMTLLRSRVKRMEALINGLLKYSRVGRMEEEPQQVDVAELLDEVLDMQEIPPAIAVEIEGTLPTIVSERLPLQQVLSNLIGNAVKHRDRPEGTVKISATRDRDVVVFAISDDGPGIDPQYHEKIFTIFQTLEARDKVESTGIGLSIVKKIVDARGGTITVRSQVGEGATFAFTWPAAAAP
ncbi:MAG: PAS domain S-box protein, partial [Cyanobacteria bacterium J06597_1]